MPLGRRRPPLSSRQSQESLLSPRSLSHSMSSFDPTPRSLTTSLDLSTAEETPRDDLALSWPMSPRTMTTRTQDTPGDPIEAFSARTPSPIQEAPTPVVAIRPTSDTPLSTTPTERASSASIASSPSLAETGSDEPSDAHTEENEPPTDKIPVLDLSLPEETSETYLAEYSGPVSPMEASYEPNTSPPNAKQPQSVRVVTLTTVITEQKEPAMDLEASFKSTASLGSLASVTSQRTPTPTARTPRGGFIWRPVQPGYRPPEPQAGPSVVIKSTVEVQRTVTEPQNNLKDSIPYLPRPVAIVCFILNILCPGLGTLTAGLSVMCCAKPRPWNSDKWNAVLINSWVALLQLLTTILFLLGWIWSIIWGSAFVQISNDERAKFAAVASIQDDNATTISASMTSLGDDTSHVAHRTRPHQICSSTTTATATTTISCEPESAMSETHPIIILQEAPIVFPGEMDAVVPLPSVPRQQRTLNRYNPRHQRALRRQNTEEELPPILLTPETLENIVIHNASTMPGGEQQQATGSDNLGYTNPKSGPSRDARLT